MKKETPLVTVYITNHNYAGYLKQSIESILAQKFTDFELIIIDDGSTDRSREIITQYEGDPRIRVVFQENKGLTVANNIALRLAKGSYLMRVDADDFLDENALLVMANYLDRHPEVGLVFPDYYLINPEGEILSLERRHDFQDVSLYDQPAHGACTMIRRRSLLELGGYSEDFRCQDGYDLWLRFIQEYKVANINLPLFYYRQHTSNLTRDETTVLAARAAIKEKFVRGRRKSIEVLCIIPVRGNQADPHSIVFKRLGGRVILDMTIEAALKAKSVAVTAITTADPSINQYVQSKYGDEVIIVERPPELVRLNTRVEASIAHCLQHCVQRLGHNPEALLLLYAEAPFRDSHHVDMAVNAMRIFDTDSVIAVRPEVDFFYQHNGSSLVPIQKDRLLRLERENLYRESAGMHLVKTDYFKKNNRVVGGRIGQITVDRSAALVIRSEFDFWLAEKLAGGDPFEKVAQGGTESVK